jgi:hypothetical protein
VRYLIGGCSTSVLEKIRKTGIGWLVFDDRLVRNLNFVEVLGTFLRDVSSFFRFFTET